MALMIAIACAALTAGALFALLRTGWAHAIALDLPNQRSLHTRAVPRSGGLALIVVAMIPALWLGGTMLWIGALALLLMIVSAADDRAGLPVLARLVAQVVLAGAAVALIHGVSPVWSAALLVLVTVWAVNAYNFMDGSDGMAGGMAVIGFGSYAVDAALMGHTHLAIVAAGVAGASAGFLVFNFAPARVFMGDAGSAPLGFLAAILGLLGWEAEVWSAWFPVIVFSPFLTDATLTLLRRLARGERIWLAHKEHLYQRMVASGLGHTRTAFVAYGVMVLSAGLALAVEQAPSGTAGSLALAWLVGCVLLHFFWVRRFSPT
jgi:UDP-N-acetylmuramyl pentapeptide phosphotransferase/UDP-N-acetylglucosamine-1-phosphate transferase